MNDDVVMDVDWKKYCLEHAGEEMPPEAAALLQQDPSLRSQVDRLALTAKLISLKQYEQPHPAAMHLCLRAVQARIEQRSQASWLSRVREWFELETPAPAMAYGLAVAALCLVGAGIYVGGWMERGAPMLAEAPVVVPEAVMEPVMLAAEPPLPFDLDEEQSLALAVEMPSIDKPIIMLRVNELPPAYPSGGRMSFGSEFAVPVNFEY